MALVEDAEHARRPQRETHRDRALGAAFYIPTVIVPPLLVTHALIFRLLLRETPQLRVSTPGRETAVGLDAFGLSGAST
jgi:hypothetical protein